METCRIEILPIFRKNVYILNMERYDCAVIGTGPAGLSAAITLKLRGKSVTLIGENELSRKISSAHTVKNYLGLPDASGHDMQTAFLSQLSDMEISVKDDNIKQIYAMGEYFALQGRNDNYEAVSVILAVGISSGKTLSGETDFLGRGVSYCATCDGYFYTGKTIAAVCYSREEEKEVLYLSEIAGKVLLFPMYEGCTLSGGKIEVIHDVPKSVQGSLKATSLVCETSSYDVDGIFILKDSVPASQLVPGLEMSENKSSVIVDRLMKTNIKGCFACGDITGKPYQYIKAAGEGNVAALSAVEYISGK